MIQTFTFRMKLYTVVISLGLLLICVKPVDCTPLLNDLKENFLSSLLVKRAAERDIGGNGVACDDNGLTGNKCGKTFTLSPPKGDYNHILL